MNPGASPKVTAHCLRRLGDDGVLSREQAVELEALLRQRLPWPLWIGRVLLAVGAGLLLAGVVFFFAYNWKSLPPSAKFALVEGGLGICALAAWRLGLEELSGKIAVFGACIFTGVFLAVHGQVYQTGADHWLLFAAWAALTLPWAALARFPALWVFWLGLVNAAVALRGVEARWIVFLDGRDPQSILALLGVVNAAALAAGEAGAQRGWRWMDEGWVRATLIIAVFGMLTAAVCIVIVEPEHGGYVWLCWVVAVPLSYWFYRQARPSLPCLTVVVLSVCTIAVTEMGHLLLRGVDDPTGTLLLLAILVMAVFCGAVFWLRAVGRVIRDKTKKEPA